MQINEALQNICNSCGSWCMDEGFTQCSNMIAVKNELERLQLIVSGKTQCDLERVTAQRIMQLVSDRLYNGAHIGMAAVIKSEFNLSD